MLSTPLLPYSTENESRKSWFGSIIYPEVVSLFRQGLGIEMLTPNLRRSGAFHCARCERMARIWYDWVGLWIIRACDSEYDDANMDDLGLGGLRRMTDGAQICSK